VTVQLLEHEAKALLGERGVGLPKGALVRSSEEAAEAAIEIGGAVAVKAQIPTGGRGKAGGIKVVERDAAADAAASLLGAEIKGFRVESLLVEEALEIQREFYLGVAADPTRRAPVLLLSASGGIDVEEAAAEIARIPFSSNRSLRPDRVWKAVEEAGIPAEVGKPLVEIAIAVAAVFRATRARIVEINPLALLADGSLVAADVRVIPAESAKADEDELTRGSHELGFDLIPLDRDGDVGLITTGAGASMMLIDLLHRAGAKPINFCDIRTGSLRGDPARILFVLDALLAAPNLKVVAVNVFAGVTDLDEVAELLLRARDEHTLEAPLVVRFEGRGAAEARERLSAAGIEVASGPEDLVERVARRLPDKEPALEVTQ
jgi:succinyl-CoA synthetase beta subunit